MDNFEQHLKAAVTEQGKKLLIQEVNEAYAHYGRMEVQKRSNVRVFYSMAAAAAVALIVFAVVTFNGHSSNDTGSERLFATYYAAPTGTLVRNDERPLLVWEKALMTYNDKDYASAVRLFEEALSRDDFDQRDAAAYYMGHAYLSQNQVSEALNAFQKISNKSLLYPDARWFIALAHLSEHRVKESIFILKSIADDSTHHKQSKALELLRQLEEQ